MVRRFESDPEKSKANARRHGVDFEQASKIWFSKHVVIPAKIVDGERRWAIIGTLDGAICLAIFVIRAGRTRIITCHRADERLVRKYEEYFQN